MSRPGSMLDHTISQRPQAIHQAQPKLAPGNAHDARREHAPKSQAPQESNAQRENRLMAGVVEKAGGERNWKSLENNPSAQWKFIKSSVSKSDYEFLLQTARDRKNQPAAHKSPYVMQELRLDTTDGLVKRNTATIFGIKPDGGKEVIASSKQTWHGQTTQAKPGYEREAQTAALVAKTGNIHAVDGALNQPKTAATQQQSSYLVSSSPALQGILAKLPANPTNGQVFTAIHNHYGRDYDRTYDNMKKDFGFEPKDLLANRKAAFLAGGERTAAAHPQQNSKPAAAANTQSAKAQQVSAPAQMTKEQAAVLVRKYFTAAKTNDYDTLIKRLQDLDKESSSKGKPTNYEGEFRAILAVRDGKAPEGHKASSPAAAQNNNQAAATHKQSSSAQQASAPAQMTKEQAAVLVRKYFTAAKTNDFDTLIKRLQDLDKESSSKGKPTNYEGEFRAILAVRDGKAQPSSNQAAPAHAQARKPEQHDSSKFGARSAAGH